jgi:ATP-dependent Clp protease ATP-binding subunit ClpA
MSTMTGTLGGLLANARRTALRRKQRPSTAHALLVMLQQDPETSRLLADRGVREADLISALKIANEEPSSAMEVAAERANRIAETLGEPAPRALHLLAAIVREPRTAGFRCLEHAGSNAGRLRDDILGALGVDDDRSSLSRPSRPKQVSRPTVPPVPRTRVPPTPAREPVPPPERSVARDQSLPSAPPAARRPSATRRLDVQRAFPSSPPALGPHDLDPDRFPLLERIGRNLTAAAAAGEIDPVVGREHEIDRLLDVLGRRRANNPVLVGPPGVGKTASPTAC